MKKVELIVAFIILSSGISSQDFTPVHQTKYLLPEYAYGDFSLSVSPNLLCNTPNGVQLAGGLKLNAYVCSWLSFDADIVAGRDYFHFGPGIAGIPLFLLYQSGGFESASFGGLIVQLFLIALSAEHVAGHIPVKEVLDISPYISLLRFRYSYEYGNYQSIGYEGEQVGIAGGIQVNKYFNRFYISPYAEVDIGYTDHIPRYNIGIYCGYYFYGK